MEEIHKLVGADLEVEDHFVDAGDKEVIEEIADDTDDEAADGGDHSGGDAAGEGGDADVGACILHILESGNHTGDGAEEAEHGSQRGHGGDEGDTFLKVGDFEFALTFDGSLDVGQRTTEAREALADHATQGRSGLLGEVAGLVEVAVVDMLTDFVHKDAVVVAFESVAEGNVTLDEDVDGKDQHQSEDNHNPSATDSHLPKGKRLGGFGSSAVKKNKKRVRHCLLFFVFA